MPDENRADESKNVDDVVELHLPAAQHDALPSNDYGKRLLLERLWGKDPQYELKVVHIVKKADPGSDKHKEPHDPTYAKTCSGG